jgi:uncharacterized protein
LSKPAAFYRPDGTLRAGWKIAAFVIALVLFVMIAGVTVGPLVTLLFGAVGVRGVTNADWVGAAAALGATAFVFHDIDKRPWSFVGLDRAAARPTVLAGAFVLGGAAIALPILVLWALGWLRVDSGAPGSWIGAALRVTLVLAPAALFEEVVSRGYIFAVLREAWGAKWALVATSVGFGLLHLFNVGATIESILLVTLAGFFIGGVLLATRSLYAAWMVHLAWNWTMAVVFHATVSGVTMEAPDYRYVDAGPDWATGGPWGPEGGIPAALGMAGGAAYLLWARKRRSGS